MQIWQETEMETSCKEPRILTMTFQDNLGLHNSLKNLSTCPAVGEYIGDTQPCLFSEPLTTAEKLEPKPLASLICAHT